MNPLSKAVLAAIASLAAASTAQAASYVVTAHAESLSNRLVSDIQAAGGTVTARLPQIGVMVVESDDPGFAARVALACVWRCSIPACSAIMWTSCRI